MLAGPRPVAALAATGLIATCTACGAASSGAGPAGSRADPGTTTTVAPGAAASTTTPASMAPAGSCRASVEAALAAVAQRIAQRAATGPNASAARRRVEHSRALASAVAAGDRTATARALASLLRAQIQRIVVLRGGHVLASAGTAPALAPLRGTIRGPAGAPVGAYVLSVGGDAGLAGTMRGVTGAAVTMRSRAQTVVRSGTSATAGTTGRSATASFSATAFPSGPLQVALRWPATRCSPSARAAQVAAVATVAHRLLADEASGTMAKEVLRHVAQDAGFRAAVAHRDPAALRAAIVRFFREPSLHVVRIRAVSASGKLIGDVGGPYVLAPASAPVTSPGGTALGRVTLSVQDDAGYVKLLHGYTGAQVVLRTRSGEVPSSTLRGAPAVLPTSGTVTIRGTSYAARSFSATAFPNAPLRISALVPVSGPGASASG